MMSEGDNRFKLQLWALFILLIFSPRFAAAQEDNTRLMRDSLSIEKLSGFDESANRMLEGLELPQLSPPDQPLKVGRLPSYSFSNELHLPYHVDRNPLFRGDFTTEGVLWQNRRGMIYGTGAQETVPGIGRFNTASLAYHHAFGDRLSLQASVNAMKINRLNFVGETFSTSGRMSYRASDRVALNVFGTYNIGNTYGMGTDSYGASVSVVMSDNFRMEMGAQRVYNAMTGSWETIPVAIPTYRFNNGFELGLDVGSIIYQILRSTVVTPNNSQRREGPTIAPPRLHVPMR